MFDSAASQARFASPRRPACDALRARIAGAIAAWQAGCRTVLLIAASGLSQRVR
jgi:hypothetical protein